MSGTSLLAIFLAASIAAIALALAILYNLYQILRISRLVRRAQRNALPDGANKVENCQ